MLQDCWKIKFVWKMQKFIYLFTANILKKYKKTFTLFTLNRNRINIRFVQILAIRLLKSDRNSKKQDTPQSTCLFSAKSS